MTNHLTNETSPYLLQHAENPVDWFPWCDEALEKAKKEDKPILLSIGYSSCHWCHVMQDESYKHPEIAKILNRHFIPVKVDRELQPALDEALMAFVQSTQGRGGWPLNVFLTPEGYLSLYLIHQLNWRPQHLCQQLDRLLLLQ